MSESKEKSLRQTSQASRFSRQKNTSATQVRRSATIVDPSPADSDKNSDKISVATSRLDDTAIVSIAPKAQDSLRRWATVQEVKQFQQLMKDMVLRQGTKQEEKRLNRIRVQRKLETESDSQLCLMALNKVLEMSGQVLREQKQSKTPVRLNQQKQIRKAVNMVDQQIALNNYVTVKSTLSTLLKRFSKDQMIQDKVQYYEFMLGLIQSYEHENHMAAGLQGYIQRLSAIEATGENAASNSQTIKALKKDLTFAANKENKKKDPSKEALETLSNVEKLATLLAELTTPKTDRKDSAIKRQDSERKGLQRKPSLDSNVDHSAYLQELLQKSNESKETFYKELDALKRTKRKSQELPYSVLLKVYEGVQTSKKETQELNLYLKAATQLYARKNYTAQVLEQEFVKLDEKYQEIQLLATLRDNLNLMVVTAQEKATNQSESELKKLQRENEKLAKTVENLRSQVPQTELVDKKKEREEKKARDAQRLKMQKEEKEINRSLESILNACSESKWKPAETALNSFHKKFHQSTIPGMDKTSRCLLVINSLIETLEGHEKELAHLKKQSNTQKLAMQKDNAKLQNQIKEAEQYQLFIKDLLENFNQEGYPVKKVFEDIRKNRKKVVQERYQVLTRLEQPLMNTQSGKAVPAEANESRNISLNLSGLSAQSESALQKEAGDLIQLVDRIEKGGQWWKFIPKNLKNSSFKSIYKLLEKYRQSELTNRQYQVTQKLVKEDVEKYQLEIKKLNSKILDLQFRLESMKERPNPQLEDSASRKSSSSELRSSRKSARSRQKEGMKQAMQNYIQQERNMLNKIEQLQHEKSVLQGRNRSLEQEIAQAQQREVVNKKEYDNVRGSLQMEKIMMREKISELEGEVQITEGRKTQVENRLESELSYYREMHGQLTTKLQGLKQREDELTQQAHKLAAQNSQLKHSIQSGGGERAQKKYALDIDTQHVFDINLSGGLQKLQRKGHKSQVGQQGNQEVLALQKKIGILSAKIKQLESEKSAQIKSQVKKATAAQQRQFKKQLQTIELQFYKKWKQELLPEEIDHVLLRERGQWQMESQAQRIKFLRLETDYKQLLEQKGEDRPRNDINIDEILQQKQREWNTRKEEEIRGRIEEVELHWISILESKERAWKETSPQSTLSLESISELQLLTLIRSQKYAEVVNTMLAERQAQWEQARRGEWQRQKLAYSAEKIKQAQQHYEDLVLPSKYIEWQQAKNSQLQALRKKWEQQSTQHWEHIINTEILPAKVGEAIQNKQAEISALRSQLSSMTSPNDQAVIESWKQLHLPELLQQEGNYAIQHFIDNQLPKILSAEQLKWEQANQKSPHQDIAAVLQHQQMIWQQEKQQEIEAIEIRWERQMKQMQTHLQGQIIEEQEKVIQWQRKTQQMQHNAVAKWKQSQLPLILARQEEEWRRVQVHSVDTSAVLRQQSLRWEQEKAALIQTHQEQLLAQKMRLETIINSQEATLRRLQANSWQEQKSIIIQNHQAQLLAQKMRLETIIESQQDVIRRYQGQNWQNEKAIIIASHQEQLLTQKMRYQSIINSQDGIIKRLQSYGWEQEKKLLIENHQSQLLAQKMKFQTTIHNQQATLQQFQASGWEQEKASLIKIHQEQLLAQKMRLQSIIHSQEAAIRHMETYNWEQQKMMLIESHQAQLLGQKMSLEAHIQSQQGAIERLEERVRQLQMELAMLRGQTHQPSIGFEMHLRGVWQQEWNQRQIQIEEYWKNLLAQKEREGREQKQVVTEIDPQIERELRVTWQQQKDEEWRHREVQIEGYWQNLLRDKQIELDELVNREGKLIKQHKLDLEQIQKHSHSHTHTHTQETVVLREQKERWQQEKQVIIQNSIQAETLQLRSTLDEQLRHITNLEGEREQWQGIRRDMEIELADMKAELLRVGQFAISEAKVVWLREQEGVWSQRQVQIQTYWQNIIREKEQDFMRHQANLVQQHQIQLKQVQNQAQPSIQIEDLVTTRMEQERTKWNLQHIQALSSQERHYQAQLHQLQTNIDQLNLQYRNEKAEWSSVERGLKEEISQLRKQIGSSMDMQTSLRTVWLQEQQLQWGKKQSAIQQYWQNILKQKEVAWSQSHHQKSGQTEQARNNEFEARLRTEKVQLQRQISSKYETELSNIKAEVTSANLTIQQLRVKLESTEGQLVVLENSRNQIAQTAQLQTQKLGDQLAKSRAQSKDCQELNRIIEKQKEEIQNYSKLQLQSQAYRKQIMDLKEIQRSIQIKHQNQVHKQRLELETHILKLTSQCENLNSRLNQINVSRVSEADIDTIASLERQIQTLQATVRTKDDEINFLRKTIESVNKQLKEAKERVVEEAQKKTSAEKTISQLKSSKMELEYQLKFLKEKEESMIKKAEAKDQEIVVLKAQIGSQNEGLERKLRNALEAMSTSQIKYTEIEALLTIKTKETQSLSQQLDRHRYQVQKMMVGNQSAGQESSELRRSIRSLQEQVDVLNAEKNRHFDETNSLKLSLTQSTHREEQLKRQLDKLARIKLDLQIQKSRLAEEVRKLRSERNGFSSNLHQNEKIVRVQAQRCAHLEQELMQWRDMGSRDADPAELQLLNKINKDVSQLAFVNRQLQTKCMLLQNRNVITSFSSSVINYFLLVQKHTDSLVNYLVKEGYVSEVAEYHQFAKDSYQLLAAGHIQAYFEQWEELMRNFFRMTIANREQQLRNQADELLKLKDEMNDVLERQIDANLEDQNQLLEDYKAVFKDIKVLVKEYRRTQDHQYMKLLCDSLGIHHDD